MAASVNVVMRGRKIGRNRLAIKTEKLLFFCHLTVKLDNKRRFPGIQFLACVFQKAKLEPDHKIYDSSYYKWTCIRLIFGIC